MKNISSMNSKVTLTNLHSLVESIMIICLYLVCFYLFHNVFPLSLSKKDLLLRIMCQLKVRIPKSFQLWSFISKIEFLMKTRQGIFFTPAKLCIRWSIRQQKCLLQMFVFKIVLWESLNHFLNLAELPSWLCRRLLLSSHRWS